MGGNCLVRRDDISSTEKLLDLIRENSAEPEDETRFLRAAPSVPGTGSETVFPYVSDPDAADFLHGAIGAVLPVSPKSFYQKVISFREKNTVGIDFGNGYLKLVRFRTTGGQKRKLTAYMSIPAEKNLSRGKPQPGFLKSVMKTFCHSVSRMDIWAVMSLENVETRFLTVPMVSEKELPNAVYWEYRKTKSVNEDEYLFDFEYIGEHSINGLNRKAVMAYMAPRREIEQIRDFFSEIGFPLTGISIYPFAIRNLIRSQYIRAEGQNICCLYVGSRIDIFFPDGNLALSRRIRACMSSMLEELRLHVNEHLFPPDPESAQPGGSSVEVPPLISDDLIRKIFSALIRSSTELEILLGENDLNVTAEDIFRMLFPAIDRLVWQVERTIESYQMDIERKGVGKIFISGEISGCRRVIDYIGTCLDQRVETRDMDPFSCDFVDRDMQIPDSAAERGSYVPAVGMALSRDFFTPNFLFTHKDRQRYLNSIRADRFVSTAFVLIAIVCIGIFFAQERVLRQKDRKLETLRREYETRIHSHKNMVFDRTTIEELADRIIKRRERARNFSSRYTDIAVISAICEATKHPQIRLADLKFIAGETKEGKTESRDENDHSSRRIIMQGIITAGDAVKREALLFDYQASLNDIPVFSEPVLREKKEQMHGGRFVLFFVIQMGIKQK